MKLSTLIRYARPRYLLQSRLGRCTVCGRGTIFVVADARTIRENAFCIHCRSSSRNRHVGKAIVEAFSHHGIRCAKDLADVPSLRIYNTAATGCLPRVWGRQPHIVYSECFDDCKAGECRDGVLCQDLQALTFQDECFDLVISEDVLEHVKDYRRGLREIHRVLKRGGYHIFSIPLYFQHHSLERLAHEQGRDIPLAPIEYHGDPIRGSSVVFTTFGFDLFRFLNEIGFEAHLDLSRCGECRKYGTFGSFTFVTRKV